MRLALALLVLVSVSGSAATTVTLVHFSDYHSHALPFYSEDDEDQGGIARAVAYLRRQKKRGALVLSGGDMMNKGAPAWSDKYNCVEWPWLNGLVDAMAFGNHDADYGYATFVQCKSAVQYPILSANTEGLEKYRVFEVNGLRIGVFALAGPDFPALVKLPELRFSDAVTAAHEVVRRLREEERVDAVVLIGHEHTDDDFALAKSVRGIDVIFGTHSHLKKDITQIPGTNTLFISPHQYVTYISHVELTFDRGKIINATGNLVRMDRSITPDRKVARLVARMQRDLERDTEYRELFKPIAVAKYPMPMPELAKVTVDVMRNAAKADFALSTISSFRGAIPAGAIDLEILRGALPYDNQIVVATMTGEQLGKLLAFGETRKGMDSYPVTTDVPAIDKQRTYRVATTDYLARASGYRDFFPTLEPTGLRVRDELRKHLAATWTRK